MSLLFTVAWVGAVGAVIAGITTLRAADRDETGRYVLFSFGETIAFVGSAATAVLCWGWAMMLLLFA